MKLEDQVCSLKIELRAHYWPETPHLREIKIFIDGKELVSSFMNQDEIWEFARSLRYVHDELMEVANQIEM